MKTIKKCSIWAVGLFVCLVGSQLLAQLGKTETVDGQNKAQKVIRVGIYDSRAIAVAFGNSKYETRPANLVKEYEKAKEAKDQKRMEELTKMGEQNQKRLHEQAFGNAPVDDLLVHIQDKFPELMQKAHVDLIVSRVVCHEQNVELVDVTDVLVQQYEPSEKTLKYIKGLLKHKPLDVGTEIDVSK